MKNVINKNNNKVLINILYFDVFLELIKNLDVNDVYNLFIVTKSVYKNLYLKNKDYFNKILINKILSYFYLDRPLKLENSSIDNVHFVLMKIYQHFKYHRSSFRIDFLVYMLENNLDCDILFEYFANLCEYKNEYTNNSSTDLNGVYLSDIIYIFKNCNYNQLKIILRNFTISIKILDFIIDDILLDKKDDWRFMLIIDYIFYKHCFGSFDQNCKDNIHNIIMNLILNKRTKILQCFLENKRYYFKGITTLEYQVLVNKIIDIEDRTHLQLVLNELKYDNIKSNKSGYNEKFVIIRTSLIKKICKNGNFEYLKYLVNEILGDFINYKLYINSICEGIEKSDKIENIECLSSILNDKSKFIINNYLKKNIFTI